MKPKELKKLRALIKSAKLEGLDHIEIRDQLQAATEQVDDSTERPTWQLLGCADKAELTAAIATPAKAQQLTMLLSMGTFSATENTLMAIWKDIFGDQAKSVTALKKLGKRLGSKIELNGLGNVTETDVSDALLRTAD